MSRTFALPYRNISNEAQLEELGASARFTWSDGHGHAFQEKDADDTTACHELEGFLPGEMDVQLDVEVSIEDPRQLFGKYVSKDAELGLALQYQFEKIGSQGAIPFGGRSIKWEDKVINRYFTHVFHKSTFRDVSGFSVLLYVKNPGIHNVCFAKNAGAIVGRISGRSIITGGSGYIFPLYKESKGKHAALWRIESSINAETLEEPLGDMFSVFINVDNVSYQDLCLDAAFFTPLKLEMFSTICTFLVDSVRHAGDERLDIGGDTDGDSVICHVRYFMKRFLPDLYERSLRVMPLHELADLIRNQLAIAAEKKLVAGAIR